MTLFDGSDKNYDKEIADKIIARIAAGEYTHDACLAEGMQPSTVYGWRDYQPDFAIAWQLAHEHKAQSMVKKAFEVLADPEDDDVVSAGENKRMCNNARVNRKKHLADKYIWWATKCDKSLGEKDVEFENLKKAFLELEKKVSANEK